MSKLKFLLTSSKFKKASVCFLIIFVLMSSFVVSSSANDETYTLSGTRQIVDNPYLALGSLSETKALMFVQSGSGYLSVSFMSFDTRFLGFAFYDSSAVGANLFSGITVYDKQFGWLDESYKLVNFGSGIEVDLTIYNWWLDNSVLVDDSAYQSGYLAGLEAGKEFSGDQYDLGLSVGYDNGYSFGYNDGYSDGRNSTDSENFGQNLLGDTLSAPMRALNQFVIYQNGNVTISLGLVLGAVISLTLFLAFLKMFAGG